MRDKDGISAALVFAELAGGPGRGGRPSLGYLEEIQREFGLYVCSQRSFTIHGASGAETIARVMDAFRKDPPARVGERTVESVKDYKARTRTAHGRTEPLSLPPSNVLAYGLEGGAQ